MMEGVFAVLGIAGAITLGAMSPGPSFVLVARTSVARSRADGLAMALAMGVGGVLFALLALAGVQVVLATVPVLYGILKVLGGVYLVYLAWMLWRHAAEPIELAKAGTTSQRAFWLGLATQVSNPKTAVVYASVFVSLLPKEVPTVGHARPAGLDLLHRGRLVLDGRARPVLAGAGGRLSTMETLDRPRCRRGHGFAGSKTCLYAA